MAPGRDCFGRTSDQRFAKFNKKCSLVGAVHHKFSCSDFKKGRKRKLEFYSAKPPHFRNSSTVYIVKTEFELFTIIP